jgi:hypothetical protein
MKSKFLSLLFLALSLNLFAQAPTLTLTDFPFTKSDVVNDYRITSTGATAVPTPKPGTNQVWNYGKQVLQEAGTFTYFKYSEPVIPALTHIDIDNFENVTAALGINYDDLLSLNTNGFQIIGRNYLDQHFGIGALTGAVTDSFIVPEQYILYKSPITIMKFPMTMGTNWTSDATRQYNAKLTIGAFGVKNANFVKRSREMRKDSVVGWGDVTVPIGGKPSEAFRCLMVHRNITVIDSIFLDGKPAPAALMQAFGLVQGKQTLTSRKVFWRAKELYPTAIFRYNGSNFTNYFDFIANQHGNLVGINDFEFTDMSALTLSPNPTSDNRFQFTPTKAEPMIVTISDISGKILLTTSLAASNAAIQIELPNAMPTGLCLVRVDYQTSKTSVLGKLVVR